MTDVYIPSLSKTATSLGQIGKCVRLYNPDVNTLLTQGNYYLVGSTNSPDNYANFLRVYNSGYGNISQLFHSRCYTKICGRQSDDAGATWNDWFNVISRADVVNIYFSKTGSDSNDGMSYEHGIVSFNRAIEILDSFRGTTYVIFWFGPGEWGDIHFQGIKCEYIIRNYDPTLTDQPKAITDTADFPVDAPTFGTLTINGYGNLSGIYVNTVYFVKAYTNVFTFKFKCLKVFNSSIVLSRPVIWDASDGNEFASVHHNSFFGLINKVEILNGGTNNFIGGNGAGTIHIGNNFSYTGSITGRKIINGFSVTTEEQKTIDDLPGTSSSSTYNYYHNTNQLPSIDNTISIGNGSYRWSQVYSAAAAINTSDEREKTNINNIPDTVLDAWGKVGFKQFQFIDSLNTKGNKARIHIGVVAQPIDQIYKQAGLDASKYGFFCLDSWEEENYERKVIDQEAIYNDVKIIDKEETYDSEGNIISPEVSHIERVEISPEISHIESKHKEAGNRYGIRYEEALCLEAAYQRRRADRLEERIAALEAKLS